MSDLEGAPPPFRGRWRLIWRLPLFIGHILVGLPLALICFLPGLGRLPAGGMPLKKRAHQAWQRMTLRCFGIRIRVSGQLPDGSCLIVANHISWMDIVLLQALWPMWMVSKAEVRHWPLIGWMAHLGGTIFIERGRAESRRRAGRRMSALLKRGERVGIFPEGGIREERGVGRFHAPLFAPAIRARTPVVPVAIRYDRDGDLHESYVFGRGEGFARNLLRLMAEAPLEGRLIIGPALTEYDNGRRPLAESAGQIVKQLYEYD